MHASPAAHLMLEVAHHDACLISPWNVVANRSATSSAGESDPS
jgi:hypothetical protein